MRQYVLTDIPAKAMQDMEASLAEMGCQASIEHLCWLPVPESMLSPLQKEHAGSCGPYAMALETEGDSLRMELLVRARSRVRCECIAYAPDELVLHMIHWLNGFAAGFGIEP